MFVIDALHPCRVEVLLLAHGLIRRVQSLDLIAQRRVRRGVRSGVRLHALQA
jgi:hypothetical protein